MGDSLLDSLWLKIVAVFTAAGNVLYRLTSVLHPLGAAATIFLFALAVVALTRVLDRLIITRRYTDLEQKFLYWKELRDRTTAIDDREKAARMARNIDEAELNRIYYDYFFEGLLLGLARRVIPIIFGLGFINEFYTPQRLTALFGRSEVLHVPQPVGAVFWYLVSILLCFLLVSLARRWVRRYRRKQDAP